MNWSFIKFRCSETYKSRVKRRVNDLGLEGGMSEYIRELIDRDLEQGVIDG